MFRLFRHRCIIFRYIIFWLFAVCMIKFTIIFYYDLQDQSMDSTSLALPYDDGKPSKVKQDKLSTSTIKSTVTTKAQLLLQNSTTVINRTAIEYFRQFARRKNQEQLMHNSHLFLSNGTRYILLVQVHTRVVYLKKFIEMLQDVENINQTLLIFSHDFIDPEINELVTNIKFVPVIQIFYPFSQQLYPDEFPGLDPDDCPRDMSKLKRSKVLAERQRALASKCKNAPYPDKYGHYREVSIVQIKHHWWWKLNFVFNSIEVLQNRSDHLLLLLEEDFYLSPDALVFLRKMELQRDKLCPECLMYTLGNLEKSGKEFSKLGAKVSIAFWHARYNLGMTISYSLWTTIVKYAEEFCFVDDYNWDWSLVYLAQKYLNSPRVMWSSSSRVIHLGSCGIHHKKNCFNQSDTAPWERTAKFFRENRQYLFPQSSLIVHYKYEARRPLKNTNGGWSDIRDRQLCLSFALKTIQNMSHLNIKL